MKGVRSSMRRLRWRLGQRQLLWALRLSRRLRRSPGGAPVLVVNASMHKEAPSFFSYVMGHVVTDLRRHGVPVRILQCVGGLSRCNLSHGHPRFGKAPPCRACRRTTAALWNRSETERYGDRARQTELRTRLQSATLVELSQWRHGGKNLGELCVPMTRWALRVHNLEADPQAPDLLREYLASAIEFWDYFEKYLTRVRPRAVVAFNGVLTPESIARTVCESKGVRFVSFEVGFRKMNCVFFADGVAAELPLDIPPDYALSEAELETVRRYIRRRFMGSVYLGGRRFWDELQSIPKPIVDQMQRHRQTVSVFTNVSFDTSQVSVNTIFPDMFSWLRDTLEAARNHPETLFVVRAHPEEQRSTRPARERALDWLRDNTDLLDLDNVVSIAPEESISSYDLIDASKFCIVYNSTVGVEATLRSRVVLSGARSKYAMADFTVLPGSRAAYLQTLEGMLEAPEIPFDADWIMRAERYLYFLVNRHSLDVTGLAALHDTGTQVTYGLSRPAAGSVDAERAVQVLGIIRRGITEGAPFCYPEHDPGMR